MMHCGLQHSAQQTSSTAAGWVSLLSFVKEQGEPGCVPSLLPAAAGSLLVFLCGFCAFCTGPLPAVLFCVRLACPGCLPVRVRIWLHCRNAAKGKRACIAPTTYDSCCNIDIRVWK